MTQSSNQTNHPKNQANQNHPQPSATAGQPTKERTAGAMEPYRRSAELSPRGETPLSLMRRFRDDMDRMFDDFGMGSLFESSLYPRYAESSLGRGLWTPRVDVFERDGKLIVHADLPGLQQQDVRVNVESDVLTIAGERSHQHEHEKGGVYQCERSFGSFERRIALPEGVAPESVNASFENGVLEVTMPMPKQQASKGRSIPIQSKAKG